MWRGLKSLLAGIFLGASLAHGETPKPPNFLFIGVDDLNDWIQPLGGHPQAKTPNITRLAEQGVLFTNAHCAAPACNPSRAALMTGVRPSTSGVYHNPQPWRQSERLREAKTMPQYLRDHGYSVMGAGKMFHGAFPDPPSWDRYFPSLDKQRPMDPAPENRPINGIPKTAHFDWGVVEAESAEMSDAKVADWVIEQLSQKHDKPLFLACGFYRPHLPWYAPKKYFDLFPLDRIELPKVSKDDLDDVPEAGRRMAKPQGDHAKVLKHGQWKAAVQGYLASVAFMDDQLGRVLDALEAGPLAGDTVIVLWTDHGWHLGEKEHWRKFALWEEATRTPVMVVAPGVTKEKARSDHPVSLLDLYPTIVELAGLPTKDDLEGNSLVPILKDPGVAWPHVALTTHGRNNHSVRDRRWRYIRYADGTEELYDHAADPGEFANLADQSEWQSVTDRLKAHLPDVNVPESPRSKKK